MTENDEREVSFLDEELPVPKNPMVVVRKPKKKKKSATSRKEYEVQVIPATKGVVLPGEDTPIKRVAAYCRVSTDEEAQSTSFDLQVSHYTEYIAAQENWVFAGIYADEGISGTQVKHREQFQKMIEDCEAGLIDMIITKSISRFARNTVDACKRSHKASSHSALHRKDQTCGPFQQRRIQANLRSCGQGTGVTYGSKKTGGHGCRERSTFFWRSPLSKRKSNRF